MDKRTQLRLTPCTCCEFPYTQQHHLLQRRDWGENDAMVPLCATCHELYHLLYSCYVDDIKSAKAMTGELLLKVGVDNHRIQAVFALVEQGKQLEIDVTKMLAAEAQK